MRDYISINNGMVYKEGGWSEEEYQLFVDGMIELADSFEAGLFATFQLEDEDSND